MKKVLIIASAILFAATTTVLASGQNATGKTQPQKAAASTTKQEPQKQSAKTETMAPARQKAIIASSATSSKKHHKRAGTKAKAAHVSKPVETPKK